MASMSLSNTFFCAFYKCFFKYVLRNYLKLFQEMLIYNGPVVLSKNLSITKNNPVIVCFSFKLYCISVNLVDTGDFFSRFVYESFSLFLYVCRRSYAAKSK